jgi:O-methyltransferase involved in polyketide biosynthesis
MVRRLPEVVAKVGVDLSGVPETLLWTLYFRASEARREDAVLEDPLAVELVDRLGYPIAERFGSGGPVAQWQALRAATFDREVRRFLAANPGGTVVALGEGLETSFWRVDDGSVQWVAVELPETIALRDRLLPAADRRRTLTGSALDDAWMDAVDPARGLLITAQGLLMYFPRADVHRLIEACAARFPGAAMVFDAVPKALTQRKAGKRATYQPPPWEWGMDADEERALRELPGIAELRALRLPPGRGVIFGRLLTTLSRVPALRRGMLTVFAARCSSRRPPGSRA